VLGGSSGAKRLALRALALGAGLGVCALFVDVAWRAEGRDLVLHVRNVSEVRALLPSWTGASRTPVSDAESEDLHWKDRRELDRLVERTTSD